MSEHKIASEVLAAQSPEENPTRRKRGTEIVHSADLDRRFFHVSRRNRSFPIIDAEFDWDRAVAEASGAA